MSQTFSLLDRNRLGLISKRDGETPNLDDTPDIDKYVPIEVDHKRSAEILNTLLDSDDFLSLSEAAVRAGITEQGIRQRVKKGELLAICRPNGKHARYPVWQFAPQWPKGLLGRILAELKPFSDYEKYSLLKLEPIDSLGVTPLEYLGLDGYHPPLSAQVLEKRGETIVEIAGEYRKELFGPEDLA